MCQEPRIQYVFGSQPEKNQKLGYYEISKVLGTLLECDYAFADCNKN